MYKEIAFDPECMAEYEYYGLLKQSFGFEKGRYVIASAKDWAKEAFQAVKASEISPVKKKSVTNYLNNLQREKKRNIFLLPTYRKDIGAEHIEKWSTWINHQHKKHAFSLIISNKAGDNNISYEQINESPENWVISPTYPISKTAKEIVSTIKPMLFLSDELIIIDQHFRLAHNEVLKKIFQEIQTINNIIAITLITSINTNNPQDVFNSEYSTKFAYIPSFKILVAPPKYFHDRYLITNNAAIKAGHGFSEGVIQGAQSDMLSLSYVGEDEYRKTLEFVDKIVVDKIATIHTIKA
ncbi:hypothetical protein QWY69_021350 [Klebsiella aerogenes]|uniref:hypothetical protein n=1 Tax=Klebsiella aerogenes TaxID=548 RepID=UPI001CC4EF8C|nr:hypothetical protein [Klebsiella aerogenes]MDN3793993.1 hypothetical protein [Klebsiella aerogenes]UNX73321.1 hypothetical protein MQE09_21855 [Klebsiella aerogenes]